MEISPTAPGSTNGAGAPPPGALIKDSDTRTFMADVVETSRKVPVIVDFWAPWCGPCKQLGPMLEKLVKQANGKVRMVKVNVDENQQLAAQMRVQSIPAVFAFVDGQPVDGFMGALPESQIKQFIDRLGSQGGMAEEIEAAVTAGREALAQNNLAEAAQIFAQILGVDREHAGAIAGLAKCQIAGGDLEQAKATLALVPPAKANDAEVISAKAALELAATPVDHSEIANLTRAIEANADDHQSRLDLAVALNAAGNKQEALDHLLHIVRRKRDWNEEAARKQLVKFFEAWGPKDEFTLLGRRKLSSILFS
ncbi:thioredoxin [Aestuariivirga sp. YIM B02566]|uniref:Thioredoxin n=1 Tax=Taklimakanibacter albus TaxID=2800327 RepID=A0ACC5R7D7_9HYPH|nr:thioredoxin [Aestuariivirga sp. YIM B02566]MBK1868554.1 thioredoxin [Aestuariivirga sp. YIM B02566]